MENNEFDQKRSLDEKVKKKKITTILVLLTLIAAVTVFALMNMPQAAEPKFTQEEEAAFVKQFSDKVIAREDSSLLIDELSENIAMLSEEEAVDAVDGILYVMFDQFVKIKHTDEFKTTAWDYINEGIDINNLEVLKAMPDREFADYVAVMVEKGYYYKVTDAGLEFFVDYDSLIKKYGDYISKGFLDTLSFYKEESEAKFINLENGELNYDVIVNRILGTEILLNKYEGSNSRYLEAFKQSNDFYNQLYFGALDFDYIYDAYGKLLDSAKAHMESTSKAHPKSELASKITKYLEKMKETDFTKTTDIEVFLLDLTNVQSENSEIAPSSEEESTESTK